MTLKEMLERYKEKKREEKDELLKMERDIRLKKRIEQKMKTPAQKEMEFYNREDSKRKLGEALERKREVRKKQMEKLSNPYNNKYSFKQRNDIMDGGMW